MFIKIILDEGQKANFRGFLFAFLLSEYLNNVSNVQVSLVYKYMYVYCIYLQGVHKILLYYISTRIQYCAVLYRIVQYITVLYCTVFDFLACVTIDLKYIFKISNVSSVWRSRY